jgi:hypothetical protein
MKKDTIIQFVCFITNLRPDEFVPAWESYARRLMNKKTEPVLQQLTASKNKFRYISYHEWPGNDFHFSFMLGRNSEHFREQNVKVVQAGGYSLLQSEGKRKRTDNDTRLIVFISPNETDMEFYRLLPFYHHLTIYQAYYESCVYSYIMEFFVAKHDAEALEQLLQQRPGVETGISRECLVPYA